MVFDGWYTDSVDVYRVTNAKVGNITKPTRGKVGTYPCRVYNSVKSGPVMSERQANLRATDKLAVALGTDIVSGDELIVTRGASIGGSSSSRYFAGDVMQYFEPVGGMFNGLAHTEVGLLLDEVI